VDTSYSRYVDPILAAGSSLIEPDSTTGSAGSLVDAAEAAMRRLITSAARSIRACRDARAAVNPEVGASFRIEVSIDDNGATTRVLVRSVSGVRQDRVLSRCIEGVVKSLPYVGIGKQVSVTHEINLLGRRNLRPTKCSEASRVSLPVRREIWRSQGPDDAADYQAASERCELRRWAERQQFLAIMMENVPGGEQRLGLSDQLYLAGQLDAAEFVQQQTLRNVKTFSELQALMRVLRRNEPDIRDELEKALKKTESHEDGLATCRKYLRLAPHNTYARRRLLSYLEALDRGEAAIAAVRSWRSESVVDAGLLSEGASALIRLGQRDEGRRAFGELIERAPRDPWTLAFVGDRLRAEGLFDAAGGAYASLARLMPFEASVTLRQALAHAGAGRVDVATRLLRRVAQTGGRNDDGRLSELASITEAAILSATRGGKDAEVEAEIERRLLRTPLPDAQAVVLVRSAPTEQPVHLALLREEGETLPMTADLDARELGLAAARVERGETGVVTLALKREAIAGPSHPIDATVSVLHLGEPGTLPEIQMRTVQVPANGEPLELKISEGRLL
jgi:tetratricopeptide (TPR) repeat protein